MEPRTVDDIDITGIDPITLEAADWLMRMEEPSESETAAFVQWVERSPRHVEEFFQMLALSQDLKEYRPPRPDNPGTKGVVRTPLFETQVGQQAMSEGQYKRYRKPLLLMLMNRNIEHDDAIVLLHQALLRTPRAGAGEDARMLGQLLRKNAIELAQAYCVGKLSEAERLTVVPFIATSGECLCIAERCDQDTLSKSVKALMIFLNQHHMSEALIRFLVHGESNASISRTLKLSNTAFEELLWPSRTAFGEILNRQGLISDVLHNCCYRQTVAAAYYVAHAMDEIRKQEFEIQMIDNDHYNREVDLWYTLKRHLQREVVTATNKAIGAPGEKKKVGLRTV